MKPSIIFVGVALATALSATAAAQQEQEHQQQQQTRPGGSSSGSSSSSSSSPSGSACGSGNAQCAPTGGTKATAETHKKGEVQGAVGTVSRGANDVNTVLIGTKQQEKNEAEARAVPPYGRPNMQPSGPSIGDKPGIIGDVTRFTDKPGDYRPFSAEFNPLGLLIGGRLSFTAEWAPVVHNAIVLNGYYVNTSSDIAMSGNTFQTQTFTGGGAELGYRYYTGHRGMNGVFVGPSLILGSYIASLPDGNQFFTNAGVAVDAGVQTILADHIIVGAGAGIEYLNVSHDFHDLSTGPSTVASSGLKPRILLSAGYGF